MLLVLALPLKMWVSGKADDARRALDNTQHAQQASIAQTGRPQPQLLNLQLYDPQWDPHLARTAGVRVKLFAGGRCYELTVGDGRDALRRTGCAPRKPAGA